VPNKKRNISVTSLELKCRNLVQALEESVARNIGDGLLLSGGLDTTIIAYLSAKLVKPFCITVALRDAPTPDVEYARLVANKLNLKHIIYYFGHNELEESIRNTVRVLKSYDPMEIRNSAAIYSGLKVCQKSNLKTVMTGDGGDELFAGYSFLFGLTAARLKSELKTLWANMSFSSIALAGDLGLKVSLPFLDSQFKNIAMNIDADLKIRNEKGQVYGKWILRKSFENVIPPELLWRVKAPAEVGTGTTTLPGYFSSKITDYEFAEKKQKYLDNDGVTMRSKEHLFYYEIYREICGVPCSSREVNVKSCPDCHSSVAETTSFCRTCGAYPI